MHHLKTLQEPIKANITLPGPESIAHRVILIAALANGVSEISNLQVNDDTLALINALRQVGIVIQIDETNKSCVIAGCNGKLPRKQTTIWCTSYRIINYLLAACSITQGIFYLDGPSNIREKSVSRLLQLLSKQGVQHIPNSRQHLPFTLVGTEMLNGCEATLMQHEANLATPLLIAAPYSASPLNLYIEGSKNVYSLDMTAAIMAEFGVLVQNFLNGHYVVPVPQQYQSRDFLIESDLGLANYCFAATVIMNGEMTLQPINRALTKQTESKFLTVLEKMGCEVIPIHRGMLLKSPSLIQGVEITLNTISNMFFALIAIAPFAKTSTKISFKESMTYYDKTRIKTIVEIFSKLRIQIQFDEATLIINPSQPKGCFLPKIKDPHLVIAILILSLRVPGILLESVENVKKIYPHFFNIFKRLTMEVIHA